MKAQRWAPLDYLGLRFYNMFWHPLVVHVCDKYNQGEPTFLTSELAAMFLASRDEVVPGAIMALTKYECIKCGLCRG